MSTELIQKLQERIGELEKQMHFQQQRDDNAQQEYDYLMQQYKNLARSRFGSKRVVISLLK